MAWMCQAPGPHARYMRRSAEELQVDSNQPNRRRFRSALTSVGLQPGACGVGAGGLPGQPVAAPVEIQSRAADAQRLRAEPASLPPRAATGLAASARRHCPTEAASPAWTCRAPSGQAKTEAAPTAHKATTYRACRPAQDRTEPGRRVLKVVPGAGEPFSITREAPRPPAGPPSIRQDPLRASPAALRKRRARQRHNWGGRFRPRSKLPP